MIKQRYPKCFEAKHYEALPSSFSVLKEGYNGIYMVKTSHNNSFVGIVYKKMNEVKLVYYEGETRISLVINENTSTAVTIHQLKSNSSLGPPDYIGICF